MLAASLRHWAYDTAVELVSLRSNRRRARLERERRQARAMVLNTLRVDCHYHEEPLVDVAWGDRRGEWFSATYLCGCTVYPNQPPYPVPRPL